MDTCYYKKIKDDGSLYQLLTYNNHHTPITDPLIVEITEEEYNILFAEIEAANQQVEPDPDEISDDEALDIILGVSE